jgi:hypothetical protein
MIGEGHRHTITPDGVLLAPAVESDKPGNPTWQQVAGAVAAAVSGAVWVATVGSAVVALRLENAGLPVESTVALMSTEQRFTIGIGYLSAPLFVGLVGFVVDWFVVKASPATKDFWRLAWAVGALAIGTVLGLLILRPPEGLFLAQCGVVVLVVPATFMMLGRAHAHRHGDASLGRRGWRGQHAILGRPPAFRHRLDERVVVFLAVLISAGVIALVVAATDETSAFDTAFVELSQGEPVEGAYVTTTSDAAILITWGKATGCPAIGAVPRNQITRIWIGPGTKVVDMPNGCAEEDDL